MSDTVNIVEAKIKLQEMRETYSRKPDNLIDPTDCEKWWVLSMNIATFDMAIRQNEGTYVAPWERRE